jgi:predicted RNA-binding Zn-ribbon protein involved in translation (DUF1610 family)
MKKVIITLSNQNQKPNFKTRPNKGSPENECAKCGKHLSPGDTAYRTSRKYFCETCGENAEIGN